jgi:hypothetical protein
MASSTTGGAASGQAARHVSEHRQSLGRVLGELPQAESDPAMSAASRNAEALGPTSDAMDNEMPAPADSYHPSSIFFGATSQCHGKRKIPTGVCLARRFL